MDQTLFIYYINLSLFSLITWQIDCVLFLLEGTTSIALFQVQGSDKVLK